MLRSKVKIATLPYFIFCNLWIKSVVIILTACLFALNLEYYHMWILWALPFLFLVVGSVGQPNIALHSWLDGCSATNKIIIIISLFLSACLFLSVCLSLFLFFSNIGLLIFSLRIRLGSNAYSWKKCVGEIIHKTKVNSMLYFLDCFDTLGCAFLHITHTHMHCE